MQTIILTPLLYIWKNDKFYWHAVLKRDGDNNTQQRGSYIGEDISPKSHMRCIEALGMTENYTSTEKPCRNSGLGNL